MLQRIYAHNFRCFENFEFKIGEQSSALLIGRNGAGKSSVLAILAILQSIGRGVSRVGKLVDATDFSCGRVSIPMRFEVDALLDGRGYTYSLALELPSRGRELLVLEERLVVDGSVLFSREQATVTQRRAAGDRTESRFDIDRHLVALTIIQDAAAADAPGRFLDWLGGMVLLSPIPRLMSGEASSGTDRPAMDGTNWADWLSGVLDRHPSAYATLSRQLQHVMPDLRDFRFERTGRDAKSLWVCFRREGDEFELPAEALSDGEKCFFLCAVVLAANLHSGALFTFWDEPDNHLSIGEVSQFITALRRGFHQGGQILMSSHNAEAIRRFSDDSTWVLGRRSHLEPTVIRPLQDLASTPDLIQRLMDGDLNPWQ